MTKITKANKARDARVKSGSNVRPSGAHEQPANGNGYSSSYANKQ